MSEFPYDFTYDPALPVCEVVLSAESTGRRIKLKAIIDTGADGTIVPMRYLQEIGLG
jgi:predicted aspartyl protease